MKCDNCGESEATIHQIHVINSEIKHLQLCESCAKQQSSDVPQEQAEVSEAFSGLKSEESLTNECSVCGTTLKEIQTHNTIGCEECFETFRDRLEPIVHRIHGADQHVGADDQPSTEQIKAGGLGRVSPDRKKQMLQQRLRKRVDEEDYERAAELRDRIEELDEEDDDDSTR